MIYCEFLSRINEVLHNLQLRNDLLQGMIATPFFQQPHEEMPVGQMIHLILNKCLFVMFKFGMI